MRGSIFYQTGELAKVLFVPKMSKSEQRVSGSLANAKTIETYREVWNELAVFTKGMYGLKDLQSLASEHIEAYMIAKSGQNITEQRFELISSAIGKLEGALNKLDTTFSLQTGNFDSKEPRVYDFSIRQKILNNARRQLLVKETSDEPGFTRNYNNPNALISAIEDYRFKLAAQIQLESGTRLEGVERIDLLCLIETRKLYDNNLEEILQEDIDGIRSFVPQLQGIKLDAYDKQEKGQLFTVEKGGKPGLVQVSLATYQQIEEYFKAHKVFKIDTNKYRKALMKAAKITNQAYQGSHGLRWNFAKERFETLQIIGNLTYEQALQQVSWEMKHERASITEHYLR